MPDVPGVYPDSSVLITSPMVGTFYRAPEPGAPPFVDIGQEVAPESIVCIIEVMKLMHSIPAGCKGIVTHIELQDGEPVQFGQVLLVIDRAELCPGDFYCSLCHGEKNLEAPVNCQPW